MTNLYEYRKYLVSEVLINFNTLSFLNYKFQNKFNIPTDEIISLGLIHIFSISSILAYSLMCYVYQQIKHYIS